MNEKQKLERMRDQAHRQFNHTARESAERIKAAKEREERLEEVADQVITAWSNVVAFIKRVMRSLMEKAKEIVKWMAGIKDGADDSRRQLQQVHHKVIQQEHQDQARLTVSIREHMQHKQIRLNRQEVRKQ